MNLFLAASFLTTNLSAGSSGVSLVSILGHTGVVVRGVLLLLLVLSFTCWTIIVAKLRSLRKIQRENEEFLGRFHQQKSLAIFYRDSRVFNDTPLLFVFRAAYSELARFLKALEHPKVKRSPQITAFVGAMRESIERAMETAWKVERTRIERWTSFLASTGSSAPFIGLFGTVWGIMNSFQHIGTQGSANLAVVAPGIAEALIATAIGLATAIPAVVAYNYFMQKVNVVETDIHHFMADFLNVVEREWLKRSVADHDSSQESSQPLTIAAHGDIL